MHEILVAVDFSVRDDLVCSVAETIASDQQMSLTYVHVMPYSVEVTNYPDIFPYPDRHRIRQRLESIRPADRSLRYSHHLMQGWPATQILDLANKVPADLLIVGTQGRTGWNRLLLGSIADSVTRNARCPVVVVRCGTPRVAAVHSGPLGFCSEPRTSHVP